MRSNEGTNLFSIRDSDMKTGRQGAANDDTKFISSLAEQFLAGLLDGLTDSKSDFFWWCSTFIVPASRPNGSYFLHLFVFLYLKTCSSCQQSMAINGLLAERCRSRFPLNLSLTYDLQSFWAPNAVTYGYDSRAASIRIISPPSVPASATRFEIRVPGADMWVAYNTSNICCPTFHI